MSKKKLILALILATVIAYFSSLGNPFIWDDEQFITSNQYVHQFDIAKIFTTSTTAGAGVQSNYYRPLTTLSFAIDTRLWGQNPFGFHLTNLAFHLGAGLVLFGLLGEVGLLGEGLASPAFWISLFFLVHPAQTEAVTYINSRGDSMYAFFLLLSLWLFARVLLGKLGRWGIFAVIGAYIFSLLSKEIALAGIGLYGAIWGIGAIRGSRDKKALWVIGMIGLLVIGYLILRLTFLDFGNTLNFYGAQNDYTRSLSIRLYTFCRVLWVYLGLLVWPYPLHMERTVNLVRSLWSPWVLGILGLFGGLGLCGAKELKRGNPWILFGLLWFLIMLIPASGIIPINGILYEHWLYLPMIGFCICLYGIMQFSISIFQFSINFQKTIYQLLIYFAILVSILYIFLTIRQNNIWADPIQFYKYTLQFAPWSARLHNNLGISFANSGDVKDAIPEYQKALQIGPAYPQIYNNLGNAQITAGKYVDAEKNLKKALQLAPQLTVARLNLIKLYIIEKQFDKARKLSGGSSQIENLINQL